MLRKVLTITLVVAMLLSMVTTVFAEATSEIIEYKEVISDEITTDEYVDIVRDLQLMKDYAVFLPEISEISSIYKQGTKIAYVVKTDDIKDIVIVNENAGIVSFDISEGTRRNTMCFTNGEIFLDNQRVTCLMSTSLVTNKMQQQTDVILPRESDRSYVSACPYGYSSDYNDLIDTVIVDSIEFERRIEDMAFATFSAVVVNAISLYLTGTVGTQTTTMFTNSATALFRWLNDDYPTTEAMSYSCYCYYHEDAGAAGYISDYGAYVTKHASRWYPSVNQSGSPQQITQYEVYRIY